tara:strand:+ start:52 stop:519 length:468 start_codon:yes stop_codon:yes gene_type:complete
LSNQTKKDNKDIDADEPPRISVEFWSAHVALTSQWLKAQALLGHIGEFMPSTEWLEEEIRSILPNSDVEAIDLNGTQDHFHIRIIDESFSSMRPLQRQKLILNHFKDYIPSPIHAIDLKCMTPQQAQTAGDTVFHPHAGGTGIHIKRIQKHQNKE